MSQVNGTEKIVELIKAGKTNEEIWNVVGGEKQKIYNTRSSYNAKNKKKAGRPKKNLATKAATPKTDASAAFSKMRTLILQQAQEIAELKLRLL